MASRRPTLESDDVRLRALKNLYASVVMERLREVDSVSDYYGQRWVWELLQNASDSIVGDPVRKSVDVKISSHGDTVKFWHNGAPFTQESYVALMYRYSEGKTDSETTGRFGTGFMTSHCLSRNVGIKSDVVVGDGVSGFEVTLYRDGETKEDLIEGMTKTEASYQETESHDYTEFTYRLTSPENMKARELGVRSFEKYISETLLFCQRVQKVTLEDDGRTIVVSKDESESVNDFRRIRILERIGDEERHRDFVCLSKDIEIEGQKGHIDLAAEIREGRIVSTRGCTCLFCTFPMIGSESHGLPCLFNCTLFEPDTERKSLLLHGPDEKDGKITYQGINRLILKKSLALFKELFRFLVGESYSGLENLANGVFDIGQVGNMDKEWYQENFMKQLQETLCDLPVVALNRDQRMVPLSSAIFPDFVKFAKNEERETVHKLLCVVCDNAVTFDCAVAWSGIACRHLREQCWGSERLAEEYSKIPSSEISWENWNLLLGHIDKTNYSLFGRFALIPDMTGTSENHQ